MDDFDSEYYDVSCIWSFLTHERVLASAPGAQGVGLTREKKRAPGIYCMRMRKHTVLFTI